MENFENFDMYRRYYANQNGEGSEDYCAVPHLLRFWKDAKNEYLNKLMGGELILTRRFSYDRTQQELTHDMWKLLEQYEQFTSNFFNKLWDVVSDGKFQPWESYEHNDYAIRTEFYDVLRNAMSGEELATGTLTKDACLPMNGHRVQLKAGQKITRAMGIVARELGMYEEYDAFRSAESVIRTQKRITGNIHLSIHPLDYATASDNANGWSSCMSWQDEGCYRQGTVEMMNSPMVICAYVSSDKNDMTFGDYTWNSKKWRAWAIVTKDICMVNRNYPYHNDYLCDYVLDWVRELAKTNLGWEYEEGIQGYCGDETYGAKSQSYTFRTKYMYNDIQWTSPEEFHCIIGVDQDGENGERIIVNYSGMPECMVCGETDVCDNDTLACEHCSGAEYCDGCGCRLYEEGTYYGPEGEHWCEDCYSNNVTTCSCCGEDTYENNVTYVDIVVDSEHMTKWLTERKEEFPEVFRHYRRWWHDTIDIPNNYSGCICDDCKHYNNLKFLRVDANSVFHSRKIYMDYAQYVFDPKAVKPEEAFRAVGSGRLTRDEKNLEFFNEMFKSGYDLLSAEGATLSAK